MNVDDGLMQRQESIAIWNALLDEGFSAGISGSIHERMVPPENYSISRIIAIADEHEMEPHLTLSGQGRLVLMKKRPPRPGLARG